MVGKGRATQEVGPRQATWARWDYSREAGLCFPGVCTKYQEFWNSGIGMGSSLRLKPAGWGLLPQSSRGAAAALQAQPEEAFLW